MAERKEMQEEETRRDEEEILSPREIAIIERWMEKHQVVVEEPIFKGPWELSLVEAVVSAGVSDKRSEIAELPEELWTKIEEIWTRAFLGKTRKLKKGNKLFKLLLGFETHEGPVKDGDLKDLTPAQRRVVEHHLKGIMAGERKELTARIEKELAEKTEKLRKNLTQQNEKMQRALGEVMEERDGLQKSLMEERQQWKKKH
jgi:hypothetical protein